MKRAISILVGLVGLVLGMLIAKSALAQLPPSQIEIRITASAVEGSAECSFDPAVVTFAFGVIPIKQPSSLSTTVTNDSSVDCKLESRAFSPAPDLFDIVVALVPETVVAGQDTELTVTLTPFSATEIDLKVNLGWVTP